MFKSQYLLYILAFLTFAMCALLPELVPSETFVLACKSCHKNTLFALAPQEPNIACSHCKKLTKIANWSVAPQLNPLLIFGTYQGTNLLYTTMYCGRIALYISSLSLFLSVVFGVFLVFLDFHPKTHPITQKLFPIVVYFPRLFFLVIAAAFFNLRQTSTLAFSAYFYIIALFGFTGALFLAAQTSTELIVIRQKIYIHFSRSLGYSIWHVFFTHVLRNCSSLPLSITKQWRDNILFLSILSFIGVIHLQPPDLGGLILDYTLNVAFYQGWWILLFPCAFLSWLILLLDLISNQMAQKLIVVEGYDNS